MQQRDPLTFLLVAFLSSKPQQFVSQHEWGISRKLVIRNVLLFLRFWFIVQVKEILKRLSARSAVEGHMESCIPIYTLLLLMEYAVKAMSWSPWGLGKVVRLIWNKTLKMGLPGCCTWSKTLCFMLEYRGTCATSLLECLWDDFHMPVCLQGSLRCYNGCWNHTLLLRGKQA